MTNEQAIRILRDLKECQRLRTARWDGCERNCFTCLLGHGAGEIKAAWDVAIAALAQEQKWIPCSEMLPEKRTDVLVTRTFEGYKEIKPKTYVEIAEIAGDEWIAVTDEFKFGRHTDPVAWMPLPKPYQKEGENDAL